MLITLGCTAASGEIAVLVHGSNVSNTSIAPTHNIANDHPTTNINQSRS